MNSRLILIMAGAAMMVAAQRTALAQAASGFAWWSNPVLVKQINLTPDQTEKVRQIVRSYRERLFDARNNVQKAEAELEDMMNDATVDITALPNAGGSQFAGTLGAASLHRMGEPILTLDSGSFLGTR